MPRVILCRPLHPTAMAILQQCPDLTLVHLNKPDRATLAAAAADADAVLVSLEPVDDSFLDGAPALRGISRFGVGYDLIDIPACTRRGIGVGVVNGANDLAVSEHTLGLMLAVAHRIVEHDANVRAGRWMVPDGRAMSDLAGRSVLVVGYGRIGTRVARLCAAFGMRVMVIDPAFPTPRIAADGYVPVTDLMAGLAEADVVTLHCPANAMTTRMIGTEALSVMKPTAWLINAARGALVDEPALIDALQSGRLAAAGLDVLVTEPPDPANPLFAMPNVVLSPHNAAATTECYEKMSIRAARNVIEILDGSIDPGFLVNPEILPNRRNV